MAIFKEKKENGTNMCMKKNHERREEDSGRLLNLGTRVPIFWLDNRKMNLTLFSPIFGGWVPVMAFYIAISPNFCFILSLVVIWDTHLSER